MKPRRKRIFVNRTCWCCKGLGHELYADSWDKDNYKTCGICKGTKVVQTSYLRSMPQKCMYRPGFKECCDICTGWLAYVKKHGHPPKDKQV